MRTVCSLVVFTWSALAGTAQVRIAEFTAAGAITITNTFTNGVAVVEQAQWVDGPWLPLQNVFSTSTAVHASLPLTNPAGFYRVRALDLSGGPPGFTNLTRAYGLLSTIAGIGAPQEQNNWLPAFENGPATNAALSSPHITMADRAGNLYLADKDAHGIRMVRPDGTIVTVAGINAPADGPDYETNALHCALNGPNGLWVRADGVFYVLDLNNGKVRRRDTNGTIRTLFTVPGGIVGGRGLWVSADETEAYVSSWGAVKKWTLADGVTDFSTGYSELGNLVMDPWRQVVVTDRGGHRVYRLDANGQKTVIAGIGAPSGGDLVWATNTAIREVRGVWFLPTGAFLLCAHYDSKVWYVDTTGRIHLFLNGARASSTHAGDGTWFYNPAEPRVSECRAITLDYAGNVLLTENDDGYIRKIRFLPLP